MTGNYILWLVVAVTNAWAVLRNISNRCYFIASIGIAAEFIVIANIVEIVISR